MEAGWEERLIPNKITTRLKNRFDIRVEGYVRCGYPVDRNQGALLPNKLKKAADVVVLVVCGEDTGRLVQRKAKGRHRHGITEFFGVFLVGGHQFPQCHGQGAASGFSAHRKLPRRV